MADPIEQWLIDLANARAGWVTRRDAAEALGSIARRAYAALEQHLQDPDVDIRAAVAKALTGVKRPEVPPLLQEAPTLAALVKGLAAPGRREVAPDGEGFAVTVTLSPERKQKVFLSTFTPADGRPLVRVHTCCGGEHASLFPWLLKHNAKLSHCAFALLEVAGAMRTALVENLPLESATPEMVKSAVKEIAHYGDWLERKIAETDTY